MDNKQLIKTLTELAQLDVDAIGAYEIAIGKILDQEIKHNLILFKNDHVQHVSDLNRFLNQLGGETVKNEPDLKGLLIEGITVLRSAMGEEGALKAMKSNEKITNKTYDKALSQIDASSEIYTLITKNRDDERKHLAYIESCLTHYK